MNAPDTSLPDWRRVLGDPECRGRLRVEPEDFRVEELRLITPQGQGSHLWLEIEKRNANTNWVAGQLAAQAGVPARDVGFAGMKDRRAVTRQWFSVGLQEAGDTEWENWSIPDAVILRAEPHGRKLKRGALSGNRFRIVLRSLEGDREVLNERLLAVAAQGVPNYFGPQRFGHGGRNVERGARWLERGGRLPRNKRSIYLSAVRSFLFNTLLSRRVGLGNWNRILDGEIASLDGSRAIFPCEMPDPELDRRCETFDIHPSGPLPGRGGAQPAREAAEIEQAVLEPYRPLVDKMTAAGLEAARRSLRVRPEDLEWAFEGPDFVLVFVLPPGAYATGVLRELVTADDVSISESR